MSEDDVRDGLRVAVADEPPFAFDADAVVTAAEQQVRRRRALVSVGVATAAVAVAAVAIPIGLGMTDRSAGFTPAAQPTKSATSAPGRYTAAELTERGRAMTNELRARLPVVVPGVEDVRIGEFGGEAAGAVADGQDYLNSFATFTMVGERYGIGINAYAPGAYEQTPEEMCAPPAQCQQFDARDDGTLVVTAETGDQSQILSVYHFRDNGSVVSIVGYNYDPTSATAPHYVPVLPVTVQQLAELAVDEKLGL